MSEQTPDTQTTDGSLLRESEPSMEDILASIRQIIADDADPVPLDGPEAIATPAFDAPDLPDMPALAEVSPIDVSTPSDVPTDITPGPTADALDIDALLSGIDVVEPDMPSLDVAETSAPEATEPALDLDADLNADLDAFLDDLDIPLLPEEPTEIVNAAPEADTLADLAPESLGQRAAESLLAATPAAADAAAPASDPIADDELTAMMDELLVDLEDDVPAEPERVVDPAEELIDADARDLPEMETSEDMDLVRSLMDDLTDEDIDIQPDVALASEPEPPVIDDNEDDILSDILDMTLDDEIADQPLDIPEPEPDLEAVAHAGAVESVADAMPVPDDHADTAPSLSDIAASAEADADSPPIATAAVAAAALTGGAVMAANRDVPEEAAPIEAPAPVAVVQPEPATSEPTQNHTDPSPLETPMPRAIRSDAILDEVTEEATASAFAELNQVVEEKAVYSERGPRIGDLVQEALKPMLKEWLDANLKGIVERAVAKEVKRISSGK